MKLGISAGFVGRSVAWPIGRSYKTLVMDPPWPLQPATLKFSGFKATMDYEVQGLVSLSSIPVRKITCTDSHLFIWATQKYMPHALNMLTGWGFRYMCFFVWDKYGGPQVPGLPQFDCEIVIYGRRGNPGEFLDRKAFRTMIRAKRGRHSEKPDEFYGMIERTTPGPRLDMFARRGRGDGWDIWGNEVGWLDGRGIDLSGVVS